MARRPHREAQIENDRSLRLRFILSVLGIAALFLWMEVAVAGESIQGADVLIQAILSLVVGMVLTLLALLAGALVRWQQLPRGPCRAVSLAVAAAGALLAAHAVLATAASPRNPLGIAEEREMTLLFLGLFAVGFGVGNRPPPADLG